MKRIWEVLITFKLWTTCASVFAGTLPESLTGFLKYSSLGQSQLAQVEFIPSQKTTDKTTLKVVLRLHFGDFASREYIAYRFDSVEYNPFSEKITFNKPSGPLMLKSGIFRSRSGEFKSEVWSTYENKYLGNLNLQTHWRGERPADPLIEPLWGEYKGRCDGTTSYLQIKVGRVSSLSEGTENPYRSYKIFGTFAEPNPGVGFICDTIPPRPCVSHVYSKAQYDFFTGKLQFFGTPSVFCQVKAGEITCDGCTYKRVSDETKEPRVLEVPHSEDVFPKSRDNNNLSRANGDYTGYLHHSYLNTYQTARLRVVSDGEKLNAMATLFFGDVNEQEFLDYRFDSAKLPGLLLSESGRTDALLQVEVANDVEISGTWFSALYGRVGRFYLKKEGVSLPDGKKIMDPVGGHYLWTRKGHTGPLDFDLYLPVIKEDVPPFVFGAQPFFPLNFNGYWTNRQGDFKKTAIPGGSYDFFTGRISFGSALFGYRNSRREVFIVPAVPNVIGAPLGSSAPEPITFISPLW